MGKQTSISWTDHTFNPWWGCTRISPGCVNCYAETLAGRYGFGWGPQATRRFFKQPHWDEPLEWNQEAVDEGVRRRVFCASMADVFEDRPDLPRWRAKLWDLILKTSNLDWLLLTKRPENVQKMIPQSWLSLPANVWLGTSVEDQKRAEERIPKLISTQAFIRFLSVEPLLGPVDLRHWLVNYDCLHCGNDPDVLSCSACRGTSKIKWVIVGGESGAGFRPMYPEWAAQVRDQCRRTGVAFFYKQGSGPRPGMSPELEGRRWEEFPDGR